MTTNNGIQSVSFSGQGQTGAFAPKYEQLKTSIDRAVEQGRAIRQGDDWVVRNIGATIRLKSDGTIISQGSKMGAQPLVLKPESSDSGSFLE